MSQTQNKGTNSIEQWQILGFELQNQLTNSEGEGEQGWKLDQRQHREVNGRILGTSVNVGAVTLFINTINIESIVTVLPEVKLKNIVIFILIKT